MCNVFLLYRYFENPLSGRGVLRLQNRTKNLRIVCFPLTGVTSDSWDTPAGIVFTMPAGVSLCPGVPVLPVLLPHPADHCRHSQCRCSRSPPASPHCVSLTAMLCCADRDSRRRCRHFPMKISCISRLFQSLNPMIARTNVRVNAIVRGRASTASVDTLAKNGVG